MFTSPTALRRFAVLIGEEQAADLLNTTTVVTIGPVTAAAAAEMGVRPARRAQLQGGRTGAGAGGSLREHAAGTTARAGSSRVSRT